MYWDRIEEATLRQFLRELAGPTVSDLKVFDLPLRAVYGDHWSTTGEEVPGFDSPDSAVGLPGRNLLVLAQAAVWCHLHDVPTLALGLLKGNPFPDATDSFFSAYTAAINEGLAAKLQVVRPYQGLKKKDVLQRGRNFPLAATWSCMRPVDGLHCGDCNKCAERQKAFAEAGIPDPTTYARRRG
jgi:7-cyano-7-deazaguanine synthase